MIWVLLIIITLGYSAKQKVSPLNIITKPYIIPRSTNQQKYVDALNNKNISILIGLGPVGTGKTFFSCNAAMNGLRVGTYNKIILTRPVVSVEEELGFLPGSFMNKMEPWTRPIFDIFLDQFSQSKLDLMIKSGIIEIAPLGYMRGRTFKDCFIIADEMQNSSPAQMKMITTRIGENSKLVITGDLEQSDRCEKNGLVDLVERYKKTVYFDKDSAIKLLEMDNSDIQRSKVVKQILDMYDSKQPLIPSVYNHKNTNITNSNSSIINNSSDNSVSQTIKTKVKNGESETTYGDAALIPLSDFKRMKK